MYPLLYVPVIIKRHRGRLTIAEGMFWTSTGKKRLNHQTLLKATINVWYNVQCQTKKQGQQNKEKTMGVNPDGTHSFHDLDDTWYRYLKADRKERKQMCEDALAIEGIVCFFGFIAIIAGVIYALCKGLI